MRKIRQNKRWKKAVSVILAGAMLCSEGGIFSTVSRQNIPLMVYAQENSDTVITSLEYYDAANGATYEKSGTTDASFGFVMPKFNGKNSSELALPEVESDLELQVNVDGEWKNINEVEYFKFNSTWGWEYQDWGGWICWFNVQETTKLRFHGKTNDVNLEYTLNFTKLETKQLSSISATVTEKEADATGGSAIGWETIQFNGGADTYEQVKDDVCILVKREGESEFVSLLDNAESGWVYDQNFGIYTEGNGGLWFSGVESAFTIRLQSKNDEQVYTEVNINFLTPERSGFTLTAVDGKTIFDAKEAEDHKATVGICLPKIDGTNPLKTDLDLFVYEVCTGAVYDQTTGNWTGGEWKDLADVEASDWVYQANGYNNYSDQQQWGYWADYVYGLWFQPVKKDMYLRIGYPENGEKGGEVGDNYIYYTFLGDEEAVIPDVSDMTDIEVDKSDMEPEGDVKEIPDLEGWSLIFHDEFNGNELDETKWSYQTGYLLDENDINTFGWGNNELEHYTDSDKNSSVADGMLKITMLKESKTFTAENGSATATYSSAKIVSKDKFAVKYGRVDFRAKLPDGDGIWPALWMMPNDDVYGSWASSGEIDVFEGRGRTPEIAFGTLHYGGTWPANTSTGATLNMVTDGNKKSDMTDWHIYSLVWEEGKIKIYVDGKCFFKCTSDTWFSSGTSENKNAPFDQQFFLIMNLAAGGWFDQNVQPDEATFTSKEMYVDYVRVYQKPTDSAALDEDADGLYGTYGKNTEQSIGTTTELTEQLTSEELTTDEKTTEQLTSEELTTEQLMGENTAETTTEQLTSEKISTEEKTTEQLTSEELTTEEKTTEQLTSEKLTAEERTTEKLTTEERTTEQLTSEKLTTEAKTTEQVTTQEKCTHRYEIQSLVSSTCTTVGKVNMICSLCGERKVEEIPVTEHSYSSEWTIDKVATKTSTGSKSHHCKICGAKTDITVIPKCETTNVTKPAKVTKLTISTGKTKQLKVKWKKVSLASGYQLMYATDKKFKKGKKIITISKKTRVSKTLKKLKKGKKYYVKVRAYKNVKGKKIYGSWSKIKVKKCK